MLWEKDRPAPWARIFRMVWAPAVAVVATASLAEEVVTVDVMPGRGAKYDPQAIYREEGSVLQGMLRLPAPAAVTAMAALPDGRIVLAGKCGAGPLPPECQLLRWAGPSAAGGAFLAVLSPDARRMEGLSWLPGIFSPKALQVDSAGQIYVAGKSLAADGLTVIKINPSAATPVWRASADGDDLAGIAVMADGSVLVCPREHPFITRIAPDGQRKIPFGGAAKFRTDFGNAELRQKYWVDLGFEKLGYKGPRVHRGGSGGVVATGDGNAILWTSNACTHPGGGPDFDPMLVKFSMDGKILWARHMLDGLPSESDQRDAIMVLCPYSGDVILACWQHGSFLHNLETLPGSMLTTEKWFTGNIAIGWIARVDPSTGAVKASTFYFPDIGRPPEAGKRFANSLRVHALRTDADNNIYVAGETAWKLATTVDAFQPEPLGGSAFLSVFNPSLSKVLYANLITSKNADASATAMELTKAGPIVATDMRPKAPPAAPVPFTANTSKTNYLDSAWRPPSGAMISLLPDLSWKTR